LCQPEKRNVLSERRGFVGDRLESTRFFDNHNFHLSSGELVVIQRPVILSDLAGRLDAGVVDLERIELPGDLAQLSAASETVARIVLPGAERLSNEGIRPVVAVVGSSGFFGKEIVSWLDMIGVRFMPFDIGDSLHEVKRANIVVSAVGKPGLISDKHLKSDTFLLIDLGFRYDVGVGSFLGDFDRSAYCSTEYFTPVPGGVGPLNVLTLLERAVRTIGRIPLMPWCVKLN
jgi:methylenetetrahydrofolate dehydrogenase (NADP+) / methenyltetrahydrofolate cyclohydrolase